jgi:hypothetical protein
MDLFPCEFKKLGLPVLLFDKNRIEYNRILKKLFTKIARSSGLTKIGKK